MENAEETKGKKLVLVRNLDFYFKCNRKQLEGSKQRNDAMGFMFLLDHFDSCMKDEL